jgi:hypothetical protein
MYQEALNHFLDDLPSSNRRIEWLIFAVVISREVLGLRSSV